MENNNFQNDANSVKNVNDVTENVNAENKNIEKEIKKGKRKTVVLIIILLILVLILGLIGGILISGNGNKVVDNIIHITDKKDENKTGKKIDESKDWVYDAEYLKDKKEIVKTNKDNNLTFKSTNEITLPYININSDDAKKVNEEIKKIAENAYADFGAPLQITNGLTGEVTTDENCFSFTGYSYENYVNNNILSVVIKVASVAVPGDGSISYITYNFDLETLNLINITDILEKYGFKSQADFNNKMKIKIKNMETEGEAVSYEDTEWDGKRFFVKDNKINVVTPGLALGEYFIVVDPNVVDKSTNASISTNVTNQTAKTDFSFMANEGFKNVTYASEMKNNSYYYKIVFDGNGNPTISVEHRDEYGYANNMYGTYRNFYNINEDAAAGNVYVTFKFKDLNGTGSEQNGTIHFSHATDDDSITLKLSVPYGENKEITLNKLYEYTRPDDTERTTGNLTITTFTNHSFSFQLDATHINGPDIEEAKARGGVNLGYVAGFANKINNDTYEFVPENNDEIMAGYDSEYKIHFIIKNNNSIEVKEIYDNSKYSQGPYAGANVRFDGVYTK